ncbi:MAG TPA: hypothetical protein VF322_02765 [Gammaproteobacteria bacterium]
MSERVVLVVSVWLHEGQVAAFEEFEREIAKIQQRHGGKIERAIRTTSGSPDAPFEVHVVSFPDAASLAAYRADPAMKALAPRREGIFRRTEILEGRDVPPY